MNKSDYLGTLDMFAFQPGTYQADMEILKKPLEMTDSVISVHCNACDAYLEMHQEGAKECLDFANIPIPENWQNKFIEIGSCIICKNGNRSCELKEIV